MAIRAAVSGSMRPEYPDLVGDTLPLDILHGDVERILELTVIIDLDKARVEIVKLTLDSGAAPLGYQHLLCIRVVRFLHQFQHRETRIAGVAGEIHIGHAAAEFANDFVRAESADRRRTIVAVFGLAERCGFSGHRQS
jgi:hypothetical protein